MKNIDVYGLGAALVDILVKITESEFKELGLERGSMRLVDDRQQAMLLERFKHYDLSLVSGGSVANSIIALSQLGGKGAFAGCFGDDRYGMHYLTEFEQLGIELNNQPLVGATTGTVVILVTPDSERTLMTNLAISAHLGPEQVSEELIRRSRWLFIEGYLLANGERSQQAVRKAIQSAASNDCKVALTFSDSWVIENFRGILSELLPQVTLAFANEKEACTFTDQQNPQKAFTEMCKLVPNVVMTLGANGVKVRYQGRDSDVPAFACKPVDLTGAGDMLAAAFLYGITQDLDPFKSSRAGCYLAMKVITQIGARLHTGTRTYWEEAQ